MNTHYINNGGPWLPVESIKISLITTEHPAFVAWLQERLPDVNVSGSGDYAGDYVNETSARRDKGARALIMGYWDEFCETECPEFVRRAAADLMESHCWQAMHLPRMEGLDTAALAQYRRDWIKRFCRTFSDSV